MQIFLKFIYQLSDFQLEKILFKIFIQTKTRPKNSKISTFNPNL
jgi:hypothetical protein